MAPTRFEPGWGVQQPNLPTTQVTPNGKVHKEYIYSIGFHFLVKFCALLENLPCLYGVSIKFSLHRMKYSPFLQSCMHWA